MNELSLDASETREKSEAVSILVGTAFSDVERELMLQTLERCDGNRTHAAAILGVSVRTLRNKIREYADAGLSIPGSGTSLQSAFDDDELFRALAGREM